MKRSKPRPTYEEALSARDKARKAHEDQKFKKAGKLLQSRCHALAEALMLGRCPNDPRIFVAELVGYLYEYEDQTGEDVPSYCFPENKASIGAQLEEVQDELRRAKLELEKHGLSVPAEEERTIDLSALAECLEDRS